MIAIPLLAGYTEHVKEKVCNSNCVKLNSIFEVEYVVGLLQSGYRYDHSISKSAEGIGIIHIT